jgi:hypothetical protein
MESLPKMFVHVDDFCQAFLPKLGQSLLSSGTVKRHRRRSTYAEAYASPISNAGPKDIIYPVEKKSRKNLPIITITYRGRSQPVLVMFFFPGFMF